MDQFIQNKAFYNFYMIKNNYQLFQDVLPLILSKQYLNLTFHFHYIFMVQ